MASHLLAIARRTDLASGDDPRKSPFLALIISRQKSERERERERERNPRNGEAATRDSAKMIQLASVRRAEDGKSGRRRALY